MLMNPVNALHGSGIDHHISVRIEAMNALRAAEAKVRALCPHGRDYADEEARQRDLVIHTDRLALLGKLHDDLLAEGLAIKGEAE